MSACERFPALVQVITRLGGWPGQSTEEVKLSFPIHWSPFAAWSRVQKKRLIKNQGICSSGCHVYIAQMSPLYMTSALKTNSVLPAFIDTLDQVCAGFVPGR